MKRITLDDLDGTRSILEILNERNISVSSECGGSGTCGKCGVMIDDEWRLACRSYPIGSVDVDVPETDDENIKVEVNFGALNGQWKVDGKRGEKAVCIDIGTTTIGAVLVEADTGKILGSASCINHQRKYGADVISRIDASNRGKRAELRTLVVNDLSFLCTELCGKINPDKIVISGNTTMEHLLLGYDCSGLGTAPYTPVNIGLQVYEAADIFGASGSADTPLSKADSVSVAIMPGISTFVGADIVSGIVACGMDKDDEISALIDLGTNGEMAVGNAARIMVASTAAGPAFEGGNISYGVAGIPGAICAVEIGNGYAQVKTIDDEKPVGICGTGVLEATSELVKSGIVDETGLMEDQYFEDGFPLSEGIIFTQKDIREVQMAKSAIRAGLETLTAHYGITVSDINTLYIAGGFGQKVNIQKACEIGMIPEELAERAVAVGNSSLAGAVRFAASGDFVQRVADTAARAEEVELARSAEFSSLYMEHMDFE